MTDQWLWIPQSTPQWQALLSPADELFYGGAAGGGKTDLLVGCAAECHQHSAIFRRVYPNLKEVIRRSRELLEPVASENKSEHIWTWADGRTLEFGAVQYEHNKTDWQGRPHDFKGFDELPEFDKSQYEFICGWNRSPIEGQRVRVVATGNPPMNDSGNWVIDRWRAWLDDTYHDPAKPGELRWYATIDGQEREFKTGEPFDLNGETIYPRSRTFIPARVSDNPFYAHDNHYISVLQSLPEPLRSMLLYGDFKAKTQPNPFQVIPTEWVQAAQARWREIEKPTTPLTAVGIDPVWGGDDNLALSRRYDNYFSEVKTWPGMIAKDGPTSAALVSTELDKEKPAHMMIDVVGVGTSTYDHLKDTYTVQPFNGAAGSEYRDRSGKLKMRNLRAEAQWRLRDSLDPSRGDDLALPDDREVLADLCTARYKVSSSGVLIEEKTEIKKRIGRSPDKGEAVMMCNQAGNGLGASWKDIIGLGQVENYTNPWA